MMKQFVKVFYLSGYSIEYSVGDIFLVNQMPIKVLQLNNLVRFIHAHEQSL